MKLTFMYEVDKEERLKTLEGDEPQIVKIKIADSHHMQPSSNQIILINSHHLINKTDLL